jgi:hypothetical protein
MAWHGVNTRTWGGTGGEDAKQAGAAVVMMMMMMMMMVNRDDGDGWCGSTWFVPRDGLNEPCEM